MAGQVDGEGARARDHFGGAARIVDDHRAAARIAEPVQLAKARHHGIALVGRCGRAGGRRRRKAQQPVPRGCLDFGFGDLFLGGPARRQVAQPVDMGLQRIAIAPRDIDRRGRRPRLGQVARCLQHRGIALRIAGTGGEDVHDHRMVGDRIVVRPRQAVGIPGGIPRKVPALFADAVPHPGEVLAIGQRHEGGGVIRPEIGAFGIGPYRIAIGGDGGEALRRALGGCDQGYGARMGAIGAGLRQAHGVHERQHRIGVIIHVRIVHRQRRRFAKARGIGGEAGEVRRPFGDQRFIFGARARRLVDKHDRRPRPGAAVMHAAVRTIGVADIDEVARAGHAASISSINSPAVPRTTAVRLPA